MIFSFMFNGLHYAVNDVCRLLTTLTAIGGRDKETLTPLYMYMNELQEIR